MRPRRRWACAGRGRRGRIQRRAAKRASDRRGSWPGERYTPLTRARTVLVRSAVRVARECSALTSRDVASSALSLPRMASTVHCPTATDATSRERDGTCRTPILFIHLLPPVASRLRGAGPADGFSCRRSAEWSRRAAQWWSDSTTVGAVHRDRMELSNSSSSLGCFVTPATGLTCDLDVDTAHRIHPSTIASPRGGCTWVAPLAVTARGDRAMVWNRWRRIRTCRGVHHERWGPGSPRPRQHDGERMNHHHQGCESHTPAKARRRRSHASQLRFASERTTPWDRRARSPSNITCFIRLRLRFVRSASRPM
jgi:hypothetical protein